MTEDGPDPIDIQVGRRLRQARLLAGMSQDDLGEAIGVSFQAVQKYEHGENRVSASRLLRAARTLGKPVSFFFEDFVSDASAPPPRPAAFDREETELVRCFRSLPTTEIRHQVLAVMKGIAAAAGASAAPAA